MPLSSTQRYVGFNLIALVAMIIVNFLAVSLPINQKTTGELAALYPNFFVPAGFTFAIWSVIYLLLIVFVLYQALQVFKSNPRTVSFVNAIGPWFFISAVCNIAWILVWHYEFVFLSVLVMLMLFYSLVHIYKTLFTFPSFTLVEKICFLLPFSVYVGWISVATIANISAFLVSMGVESIIFGGHVWAAMMVTIAVILGICMVFVKHDIAFALVIVWACYGIMVKQSNNSSDQAELVATFAQYGMTLLLIYVMLNLIGRKSYFFEKKESKL